nr:reverse transcriptase domain-containing protein [Tanacetum cinerariifolium]
MKKMMLEEFYPDKEVQRMEDELRSLKLKDTNIDAYTQRFHELVLLCPELSRLNTRDTNLFVTIVRNITTKIVGQLATTAKGRAILRKTVRGSQLQFVMNVEKRVTPGTIVRKRRTLKVKRLVDELRLNTSYEVKLADGRVASTNIVLKGCTINLVGHLFKIDLMPIELGTFDVIIGMDRLVEQDAIIVCGKKVVHVPYNNKTLVFKGDR